MMSDKKKFGGPKEIFSKILRSKFFFLEISTSKIFFSNFQKSFKTNYFLIYAAFFFTHEIDKKVFFSLL